MNILGIHSGVTIGQHDPGAALIMNGKIIAVIEEERLVRIKSPRGYLPVRSIAACLKEAGISIHDIDMLVHPGETYEDMPARIESYMQHYFGHCPKLTMINHQMAHLASAYYCSGFEDAMCISWDAYGDNLSAAFATASRKDGITIIETRDADHSLGNFYAAMTGFIGFDTGEDEFKVMGLAPYGKKVLDVSKFLRPTSDGYAIDPSFRRTDPPIRSRFEPPYSEALTEVLGGPPRRVNEPVSQFHRDVAYTAQKTLEEACTSVVQYLHRKTGLRNVCLAGGVALNCSANNEIQRLDCVDRLFVQPAASDRGLPLGCALFMAAEAGEPVFGLDHVYYGPAIPDADIENTLRLTGFTYEKVSDPAAVAAELLAKGQIIGWYQGRAEFGPRALGNRSILADPSRAKMKEEINARVKFREEFRPFAPAVIEERAFDIFKINEPSPFMTVACDVHDAWKTKLPATTHVNGTARVQTVHKDANPRFHRLIALFGEKTGVPVVLNTSFNVRGQPIVESPLDALGTFAATGMDSLIMGDYVVRKPAPCRA